MTVQEIMTRDVATCTLKSDVNHAIRTMREFDCGFVPILDDAGRLAGVLTDRDICFGLATHHRTPAHVAVGEIMTRPVHTCAPGDDVVAAVRAMARHRVRRLPVVDGTGLLRGVVSMDDVILASRPHAAQNDDVLSAMQAICRRRQRVEVDA